MVEFIPKTKADWMVKKSNATRVHQNVTMLLKASLMYCLVHKLLSADNMEEQYGNMVNVIFHRHSDGITPGYNSLET